MKTLSRITKFILDICERTYSIEKEEVLKKASCDLNTDRPASFKDMSSNIALIAAKLFKKNPLELATQSCSKINETIKLDNDSTALITQAEPVAPGFINVTFSNHAWALLLEELIQQGDNFFKTKSLQAQKILIEFVSPNPTGPLHLAHGRNAIIGDVLARVLTFQGHEVTRECYINDAGNQINLLGASLKARYLNECGIDSTIPEGGYHGDYLANIAKELYQKDKETHTNALEDFFSTYAYTKILDLIQEDLTKYKVSFDRWFSEKSLHQNGAVDSVYEKLINKEVAYEKDGALWFKASAFGDEKDRVIRKTTGEPTYLTPDIAYHINKFDRGYDQVINILGQDHHGYAQRLHGALEALGFPVKKLTTIFYQLVRMKQGEEYVKMSKRSGNFEKLSDVIDVVGQDVARFFYLNKKADAHLDFDIALALNQTEENPVYYIQYAYVRTNRLLEKALEHPSLEAFIQSLKDKTISPLAFKEIILDEQSRELVRKIISLERVLVTIEQSFQTHLLAAYAHQLASQLHTHYGTHRILDPENISQTKTELLLIFMTQTTLKLCLQLLGLSQPEKM